MEARSVGARPGRCAPSRVAVAFDRSCLCRGDAFCAASSCPPHCCALALAAAGSWVNGAIGPPGIGCRIQSEKLGAGRSPLWGGAEAGGAAAAGAVYTAAFSAPQSMQLPSGSRRGRCEQLAHLAGGSTPARHGFPTSLIVVSYSPQASIYSWGVRTRLVERQLHCAGFARL